MAAPLGLDFHLGVPPELDHRIAHVYPDRDTQAMLDSVFRDQSSLLGRVMSGPSGLFGWNEMWDTDMWNTRRMRAAEVPSTNGHGDAAFTRPHVRRMHRRSRRCPRAVRRDRRTQCIALSDGTDCVTGQPMTFGLGFMLRTEFPKDVGPRTFGHIGAGGSTAFADPDRGLAFFTR